MTAPVVNAAQATPAGTNLVDVNKADLKMLETLPGVGPATAQRIIDGRPYKSLADLETVKGLSQAKVNALKDRVTFGSVGTSRPASPSTASKPTDPKARSGTAASGATPGGKGAGKVDVNLESARTDHSPETAHFRGQWSHPSVGR